jgi:hypothetical protein
MGCGEGHIIKSLKYEDKKFAYNLQVVNSIEGCKNLCHVNCEPQYLEKSRMAGTYKVIVKAVRAERREGGMERESDYRLEDQLKVMNNGHSKSKTMSP